MANAEGGDGGWLDSSREGGCDSPAGGQRVVEGSRVPLPKSPGSTRPGSS